MKTSTNRELPIVFGPEMHRAIREGRKTETRRLVKIPKWAEPGTVEEDNDCNGGLMAIYGKTGCFSAIKPRYQVGDRLWVKEAWRARDKFDDLKPVDIGKRVGKEVRYELDGVMSFEQKIPFTAGKLRSPLFMPYWAARTWLEVTGVRAERLQEITAEGAKAEGVYRIGLKWVAPGVMMTSVDGIKAMDWPCHSTAKEAFKTLWESVNGYRSWWENHWVRVYTFKLLEAR